MKIYHHKISVLLASFLLLLNVGCETEFPNPNAPTDAQVLNSREGLFALGIGIRQLYSTAGVRFMVENNAITAREAAVTTTFVNMIELEEGGDALQDFNSNVEGLWATMLRVMSMSEDLMEAAERVELLPATRANLIAYGAWFRAMSIGALAQNYSQVVIRTNRNNQAEFVSIADAYLEAIRLLELARTNLTEISPEFNSALLRGSIDIRNSVDAYLARYYLFSGNFEAALTAANRVSPTSTSVFTYDQLNQNPIFNRVILNNIANFLPRNNFGLPASLPVDPNDGRIDFYLSPSDRVNVNGFEVENLVGFFTTESSPIPVYLPGEMTLIIAEANLRRSNPNISAAVEAINRIRTKTNDPFEVNARLEPYSGQMTLEALLNEVYVNRRIELFFTGVSLIDSRRFNRPNPTAARQWNEERNRNFYPFPLRERNNNTNTPANPPI